MKTVYSKDTPFPSLTSDGSRLSPEWLLTTMCSVTSAFQ